MHQKPRFYPFCRNTPLTHGVCYALALSIGLPAQAAGDTNSNGQLQQLQQQIDALQQQLDRLTAQTPDSSTDRAAHQDRELDISGFFDVTAHTTDNSEHPFDLGSLELDIQYDQVKNFAVSSALTWDGDTSEVAVAVLDYHINSHDVPSRGPLFTQDGFHIQFGRFDIPFGIDYEYFAAPDRANVTPPLTTERIQRGGFNGDGLRVYGAWAQLDYAVYWTNSLFENTGNSLGARIGLFPWRSPQPAQANAPVHDFSIGLSWLRDMDSDEKRRNALQALDVRWRYRLAELIMEYISLDSVNSISLPSGGSSGPADETGYNARLLLDFDPLAVFVGYGEWRPDYAAVLDPNDPSLSYPVSQLKRLTLGGRYMFDDYLQIKLEYLSHLGSATAEPNFEKRRLTFQMVARF